MMSQEMESEIRGEFLHFAYCWGKSIFSVTESNVDVDIEFTIHIWGWVLKRNNSLKRFAGLTALAFCDYLKCLGWGKQIERNSGLTFGDARNAKLIVSQSIIVLSSHNPVNIVSFHPIDVLHFFKYKRLHDVCLSLYPVIGTRGPADWCRVPFFIYFIHKDIKAL